MSETNKYLTFMNKQKNGKALHLNTQQKKSALSP